MSAKMRLFVDAMKKRCCLFADSNFSPLVIAAAKGLYKSVRTLMHLGAEILQRSRTPEPDKRKNSAKRRNEVQAEAPFPLLQNASVIQKSDGNRKHPPNGASSEESSDSEVDDLRSHNSSVVDFAIQNDHFDIVELLI